MGNIKSRKKKFPDIEGVYFFKGKHIYFDINKQNIVIKPDINGYIYVQQYNKKKGVSKPNNNRYFVYTWISNNDIDKDNPNRLKFGNKTVIGRMVFLKNNKYRALLRNPLYTIKDKLNGDISNYGGIETWRWKGSAKKNGIKWIYTLNQDPYTSNKKFPSIWEGKYTYFTSKKKWDKCSGFSKPISDITNCINSLDI